MEKVWRFLKKLKIELPYDHPAIPVLGIYSKELKVGSQRDICTPIFIAALYIIFLKIFFKLIYLFMAVLGLRFCARAFSSCGKRGPLFIAVRGPLTNAASLVAEQRLQMPRLSNCGSRAQLLRGMWDLPRPGLEPVSPALAGRFSTTAPPGKPVYIYFSLWPKGGSNPSVHQQMMDK